MLSTDYRLLVREALSFPLPRAEGENESFLDIITAAANLEERVATLIESLAEKVRTQFNEQEKTSIWLTREEEGIPGFGCEQVVVDFYKNYCSGSFFNLFEYVVNFKKGDESCSFQVEHSFNINYSDPTTTKIVQTISLDGPIR